MKHALACLLVIAAASTARADTGASTWTAATVTATSTLDADHSADRALESGQSWCAAKGDGVGQSIKLELAAPVAIKTLSIRAGRWLDSSQDLHFNRPTKLVVTIDGKKKTVAVAKDGTVKIRGARRVQSIQIAFAKVKKGQTDQASCISQIDLGTDASALHTAPVFVTTDPSSIGALDAAVTAAGAALAACDKTKLGSALAFPFSNVISNPAPTGATTSTASPADLVAAKCTLPAYGAQLHCNPSALDAAECIDPDGGDATYWEFRFASGHWKLAEVRHIVDTPENDTAKP